jgi:hypothetical protein
MISSYVINMIQNSHFKNVEPSILILMLANLSIMDVFLLAMLLLSMNAYTKSREPINHSYLVAYRETNQIFMEGKVAIDELCIKLSVKNEEKN